jgi:hypothetical protein
MKKSSLAIVVLAVLFSLSAAAFAGGGGVAVPCSVPGTACSDNFASSIPQDGKVATNAPEKKELTAEEKTLERDNDQLVRPFPYNSKLETCIWSEPKKEILDWLTKNTNVVIDRKEFAGPSYRVTEVSKYDGKVSSECTTTIFVHYHEITKGGEEKK